MSDEHDPLDEDLDAGLEALFGSPESGRTSVLQRIEALTGPCSRLFLRDPVQDQASVVLPGSEKDRIQADGRYEILGELGRGGVGVVFKGRDKDLGREVAIKLLRRELADRADVVQRFVEEAQITGQLQHPGVAPVYCLGLDAERRPYFAMKLVKGDTLSALLRAGTSRQRLLQIFEQVALAVAYAHSRGVIHRDLKPGNVMVGAFGEVQVVDWGFAKVVGRGEEEAEESDIPRTVIATVRSESVGSHSIAGSVMGTPAYMPPEQALGKIDLLDERSDVFALGAILCEILTGQAPYTGNSRDQLLAATQARLDDAHARLDDASLDPELDGLVRACLAPIPKDRPTNGQAVAGLVRDYLEQLEERARRAEVEAVDREAEATRARLARRQTMLVAGAALSAVLLAALGYLMWDASERARAEAAAPKVAAALRETTAKEGEQDWDGALAAARRGVVLAEAEGAHEQALETARDALSRAQAGAERAARVRKERDEDDALLFEMEELLAGLGHEHQPREVDALLLDVLARHGLALDDALGDRLARSSQAEAFAGILNHWAVLRRLPDARGSDPDPLLRLADRVAPDWGGAELRKLLQTYDVKRLRGYLARSRLDDLPRSAQVILGNLLLLLDPKGAARLLTQAAERRPEGFWLQFLAGRAHINRSEYDQAARLLSAAVALRPRSPEARHQLGVALGNAGDRRGAMAAFDMALRLRPGWGHVQAHRAMELLKHGDEEEAGASSAEAERLAPDDRWVRSVRSVALRHLGQNEQAIQRLCALLRAKLRDTVALTNLSSLLEKSGEFEGAVILARAGVRFAPRDVVAWFDLGVCLRDMGDTDGAIAAQRRALELDPSNADATNALANALRLRGDTKALIELERAWARRNPKDAGAWYQLGCLLGRVGLNDEAAQAYRRVIEVDPKHAEAHCNLAGVLARSGDLQAAVALYRRGHELGSARKDWTYPSKM